jgi:hypothetical protein
VLTSKTRNKQYRGGIVNYQKAKNDILNWLKSDTSDNVYFTTMFDFYALPDDFPGFLEARKISDPYEKVESIENAFKEDINHPRFIPYIQLHEFEALIFANPTILKDEYFEYSNEIIELTKIKEEFENPELINNQPHTAPSKRILELIPVFDKTNIGAQAACKIGIQNLKANCRHFNSWVLKLEAISKNQS